MHYRFGYNGQEMSNEISGIGNHNTALFWEYDTRLGRRWNLDPKPNVSISGYAAFANNPIWFSDPLGDTTQFATHDDFKDVLTNSILRTDYAKKINDLRKSPKTYKFESVPYSENNGIKGGKTTSESGDPNLINIFYTNGDNPMNNNSGIGMGPNNSLWEETYHAWDYNNGGLDLNNGTAYDEAEAWKFSSDAPGTKYEYQNYIPEDKRYYTDKTAMFRIKNASKTD